jgi:hypothetical protein
MYRQYGDTIKKGWVMTLARIAAMISLTALAACGGGTVQQTLGLDSRAPDEFKVVARPPLSVPPQFNLRPPALADGSANPYAADRQAEALITGRPPETGDSQTFSLKSDAPTATTAATNGPTVAGASSAESQFLRNAGAENADGTVRRALVEEKIIKQEEVENREWWDWMTFTPEKKDTLVDAQREAERIEQNQREGKPVNEGESASVKPKDRGVLGYILGD